MASAGRRASAYGLFTAGYRVAWFFGSTALGGLLSIAPRWAVAFALLAELSAVPLILLTRRWVSPRHSDEAARSGGPVSLIATRKRRARRPTRHASRRRAHRRAGSAPAFHA
jgi:predicted MFS family arabinose efflux permease